MYLFNLIKIKAFIIHQHDLNSNLILLIILTKQMYSRFKL